jgi:hypothetical protein
LPAPRRSALRVVSPWAIKAAVDYVFVGNPAPAWLRSAAARLGAGLQIESRLALLFAIVGLGLAAHMGISSYSSCTRASSRRSVSE